MNIERVIRLDDAVFDADYGIRSDTRPARMLRATGMVVLLLFALLGLYLAVGLVEGFSASYFTDNDAIRAEPKR